MTDNFDVEGGSIDFDEFEEWLDHVADAEGTSRRSVLKDLVSTYWILNELTQEVDPDIGRPSEMESTEDDARTDVVEALQAVGELFDQREERNERTVDPDILRLIESTRGAPDRGSASTGFDLLRLEHRVERTGDRLSDVTGELDTVRAELSAISSRVDELDDWDPDEIEQRQDAVEELVREHVDWLEEKVDTLYLELLDAIDEQEEGIDDLTETVGAVEGRTDKLAEAVEHERRERRSEIERVRETVEGELDSFRSERDDRLQTMRTSFQNAIDGIETHLDELHDRDEEAEQRMEEIVGLLDDRLESVFEHEAERAALTTLLREAQELGIRTAQCRSCERPVDLDLLTRPACPHCDRVFGGIETERGLIRKRHELATRIPGHEFEARPLTSRPDDPDDGESEDETGDPTPELSLERE